jgi:hypothetical protein
MADITYNTVIGGDYEVKVGNRYEVAEGKFGTMPAPTVGLQKRVQEVAERDGVTDMDIARAILKDLPDFSEDNAIFGMPQAVVKDFFTLVSKIVSKLTGESEASLLSQAAEQAK